MVSLCFYSTEMLELKKCSCQLCLHTIVYMVVVAITDLWYHNKQLHNYTAMDAWQPNNSAISHKVISAFVVMQALLLSSIGMHWQSS